MERSGLSESAAYLRGQLDDDIKRCMVDICKVNNFSSPPLPALLLNLPFLPSFLLSPLSPCLTSSYFAKASCGKLLRKHGFFDLLGCDFMLTESNQLHLLEVNTNPALSRDNSTLEQLLPGVVDGCIELVLRLQGPERTSVAAASSQKGTSGGIPTKGAEKVSHTGRRDMPDTKYNGQITEEDVLLLQDLPYQYQLVFNEATGFEYGR